LGRGRKGGELGVGRCYRWYGKVIRVRRASFRGPFSFSCWFCNDCGGEVFCVGLAFLRDFS
jgi:hypothetical protein